MTKEERKDLVIYRITKSRNTLEEIDLLIENKLWNTTVNRFIMLATMPL